MSEMSHEESHEELCSSLVEAGLWAGLQMGPRIGSVAKDLITKEVVDSGSGKQRGPNTPLLKAKAPARKLLTVGDLHRAWKEAYGTGEVNPEGVVGVEEVRVFFPCNAPGNEGWVQKYLVMSWARHAEPSRSVNKGSWVVAQHYVPCFYLRRWAETPLDPCIPVRLQKEVVNVVGDRQYRKPESLCVEREMYSQKFERWMALVVESRVCQLIIDFLTGRTPPQHSTMMWLITFAANLYIRNIERRASFMRYSVAEGEDWSSKLLERDLVPLLEFFLKQKWVLLKVERPLPTSDRPVVAFKLDIDAAPVDLLKVATGGVDEQVMVLLPITPEYLLVCETAGTTCLGKGVGMRTVVDAIVANSSNIVVGDVATKTLNRLKPSIPLEGQRCTKEKKPRVAYKTLTQLRAERAVLEKQRQKRHAEKLHKQKATMAASKKKKTKKT